jgi:hypothetical protein
MLTKAPWTRLLLIVLFPTAVLVLLTFLFENNALALFPTHDAGGVHGFVRCTGYGLPFAFREVVTLIDTSSVHYHWGIFVLDVALISIAIVGLARLKAYAKS